MNIKNLVLILILGALGQFTSTVEAMEDSDSDSGASSIESPHSPISQSSMESYFVDQYMETLEEIRTNFDEVRSQKYDNDLDYNLAFAEHYRWAANALEQFVADEGTNPSSISVSADIDRKRYLQSAAGIYAKIDPEQLTAKQAFKIGNFYESWVRNPQKMHQFYRHAQTLSNIKK